MHKFVRPTLNKNSTRSKGSLQHSTSRFAKGETKVNLETINKDILHTVSLTFLITPCWT